MSDAAEVNDILVFELPDRRLATDLMASVRDRWICAVHEEPGVAVLGVYLLPYGDSELAHLLRRVEAWVGSRSLGAIRYWLDRRAYILEAATQDLSPLTVWPSPARDAVDSFGSSPE
jgi:hypothetical protein